MTAPGGSLLSRPPDSLLRPDRVRELLRWFGVDADDGLIALSIAAVHEVTPVDSYRHGYAVGQARVYHATRVAGLSDLFCSCQSGHRPCTHRLAVLLVLAWNQQDRRPWFDLEPWELALLGTGSAPSAPAPRPGHQGRVDYDVLPPETSPRFTVVRHLVRFGRKDGRPLKPLPCPRSFSDVDAIVSNVTEADRAFHEASENLSELRKAMKARFSGPGATLMRLIERAERIWAEALASVGEVTYQGRRVRVVDEPLHPAVRARSLESGLELAWDPPIQALWAEEVPWVLTEDQTLCPLDPAFPRPERLVAALPHVPSEDVARFVDRYSGSDLRVFLESARVPATREARILLSEEGDDLVVEARFAYVVDGDVVLASPGDDATLTRKGDLVVRRDRIWEAAARAELAERADVPTRLSGEDAWAFLESLPSLTLWTVHGRESLVRNRLRGALTPRVSVPSTADWFDLNIEFTSGAQTLPCAPILHSWLEGKRTVRLSDGSVARLPEEWLRRHGPLLSEIEDVRGPRGLPVSIVPLAREILAEAEGDAARWAALAERLATFEGIPPRPPPPGLKATLRPYQQDGYRWLAFLAEHGLAGCLADDMGLGKTVQAIAVLAQAHPAPDAVSLVVVPTSVLPTWIAELGRFAPGLRVHAHHGPDRSVPREVDVVVTTYALLRLDAEPLAQRTWTWLILDEAQNIKNPTSQVARAARSLDARHRAALTGTPIENDLYELYSLFQFLMPGFFGRFSRFARRYAAPVHRRGDPNALSALRTRIRPFLLRRKKDEVAAELPPKQTSVLYCDLGPAHRRLYERVRDTYRQSVLREAGPGGNRLHVLEALTRLRQACCHPDLLPFDEAREVSGSPKIDLLIERLEQAIAEGHKSLVFSQWPTLLQRAADRCEAPFLYLDGSTKDRERLVASFQDADGPPVFFVSLKAGGTGLTLTSADHVFHLDPWWNPMVEDQATDRAHRIGQHRPVLAYRIVARDTVEEKILELQERKRALFESAIEEDRVLVDALSREDLEAVFGDGTSPHSRVAVQGGP